MKEDDVVVNNGKYYYGCPNQHECTLMPPYNTERWQLGVFDIVEKVVACYDATWTSGLPNSTFRAGQSVKGDQNPGDFEPSCLELARYGDDYFGGVLIACHGNACGASKSTPRTTMDVSSMMELF